MMSKENYDKEGLLKATYYGNTPSVCHRIIDSYLNFSCFGELIEEHPDGKYEAMGCFKDWWNEYISDEDGWFVEENDDE